MVELNFPQKGGEQPEPQSFKYYGVEVYNLDDLILFDPAYFYGCLKRKRNVLTKKNITHSDYYYARNTERGWRESHRKYNKAKILIKANWVRSNVTRFLGQTRPLDLVTSRPEDLPLQMAPPILKLETHEKFRDHKGDIFEVEVRGTREYNRLFFKVLDIQLLLEMDNLVKKLKHTSQFSLEEDYTIFLVERPPTGTFEPKRARRTFITYNGLLKLIFRSNSKTAQQFRQWVSAIIYSAHMGTEEQRFTQALEIGLVNNGYIDLNLTNG